MADKAYKRLDKDQLIYLTQYMFTKLKNSSLATDTNTTYTIERSGDNIVLKDDKGTTVSTVSAQTLVKQTLSMDGNTGAISSTGAGYADAEELANLLNFISSAIGGRFAELSKDISGVSNRVSAIHEMSFTTVASLPTTGDPTVIYLLPNSGTGQNIYDEYLYVNNKWEKIGTTDIDLSGYMKSADYSLLTNDEITTIVDDSYKAVFG